jgi:enoyl-CoA hydratase/carnithine racemase
MIDLRKDGHIYILTLDNQDNTICLNWQEKILAALDEMENNYHKGTALVMIGQDKFFSNGVNIDVMKKYNESELKKFARTMLDIHRRLLLLPFPTVAAINGHAFAGGAFLALSLDYRVMREDRGWISISEVDVGVPIPAPMMEILHTKLSATTVRDAVLTGKRYTANDALISGVIDYTATTDNLLAKATALAANLASKEPSIFKRLKRTLYGDLAARFI